MDDAHATDIVLHTGGHESVQPFVRLVFRAAVQVQDGFWQPFAAPQAAQQIGPAAGLQEFAGFGVWCGRRPASVARRRGFVLRFVALRVGAPLAQQAVRVSSGDPARAATMVSQRLHELHGLLEQGPVFRREPGRRSGRVLNPCGWA